MFDIFDLISKRTVENFRIAFIEETGMTLSFSDNEHKEYDTFYSGNKCEFCRLLNAEPQGLERCICSSKNAGKKAAKLQKPLIYRCHAGLSEIVVPIFAEGRHAGNVYSGQVLTKPPSELEFAGLADNLQRDGLYVKELKDAYMNIPVVPEWKLKVVAKLLSIIVDYMMETEINTALEEQIKREKEKFAQLKPYVRSEFANYIVGNNIEKLSNIREKLDFLGLSDPPDTLMLCKLDQYEEIYKVQGERFRAKTNNLALHVIEDCVAGLGNNIVHALGDGLFLVLLSLGGVLSPAEQKKQTIQIAEQIRQSMKGRTSFTCSLGIGCAASKSAELGNCYRGAMKVILYLRLRGWNDRSLHMEDMRLEDSCCANEYFNADKLSVCVALGARDEYDRLMKIAFESYLSEKEANLPRMKALCVEVLGISMHVALNEGADTDPMEARLKAMEQIIQLNSPGEILRALNSCVYEVMEEIRTRRVEKSQNVIDRAKSFMSMHLNEDITLESIASHVYLSPNYFGSLFKREVGLSCVEYLSRLRIDYAKYLLETTEKSLQIISDEAGFRDSNYFSQVFKKAVGVPPRQYRKREQEKYMDSSRENGMHC